MTVTWYDHFSVAPKRCCNCGRLFIFEPYTVLYKEVGIECYDLPQIYCMRCKPKGENNV